MVSIDRLVDVDCFSSSSSDVDATASDFERDLFLLGGGVRGPRTCSSVDVDDDEDDDDNFLRLRFFSGRFGDEYRSFSRDLKC